MGVTLHVRNVDAIARAFESLPSFIESGVKVTGDAANYALVWEFGSVRMKNPGPRTVLSFNPLGEPAVLSTQAPYGYIRINNVHYRQLLIFALQAGRLRKLSVLKNNFYAVMAAVAGACASLISDSAPIDSGNLRSSIEPVLPGDPLLAGAHELIGV